MDPNPSPQYPQPQYVPAQIVQPVPVPPRKRGRFIVTLLILMVMLGFGGVMLVGLGMLFGGGGERKVEERFFFGDRFSSDKIVILSIEGVILDGDGFVKREIDQAMKDESVKAVVVRVDSPGGSVTGSDYILHHLKRLAEEREIPLVVSMGGIAASGGYYVSMAVGDTPDTIFAEPTTWTGSIGVIIPHYEATGLMEKLGVTENSIASHRLKGMGSMMRKMTDEEEAIFDELVQDAFRRFKSIIREGRPRYAKNPEELNRLATGQVYTADQALKNGLVDRIGFVEDAVDRAAELAGLSAENTRVVEYKREFSLMDIFMASQVKSPALDPAAILDMATPRAYYLWSFLPPVFSSAKAQ